MTVSMQLMSTDAARELPKINYGRILLRASAPVAGVALLMVVPTLLGGRTIDLPEGRLHWPDFSRIAEASLVVQIHLATVLAAAIAGGFVLAQRKGTRLHRQLGWIYAGGMFVTGLVTLLIPRPHTGLHLGPFGPLHLFSLFALIGVPLAIRAARRRNWALHGKLMASLFIGGVGIAGLGAFVPGRLMWQVFFG